MLLEIGLCGLQFLIHRERTAFQKGGPGACVLDHVIYTNNAIFICVCGVCFDDLEKPYCINPI